MILKNCSKNVFFEYSHNRKVIIFGCGRALENSISDLCFINGGLNIAYIIDNNKAGQTMEIGNCTYKVCSPERLKDESDCIIVIMSPNYMIEMYEQLVQMDLPDSVDCFLYPFVRVSNFIYPTNDDHKKATSGRYSIPKVIHSFWFSGEEKPEQYQRCIDSWKRLCPEFEIKEWNTQNYNVEKNDFLKSAYQAKKWAFVSDYARLDVINRYGGVYMDMDVELMKNITDFMQNRAFFSFNMMDHIDLAMFGSVADNPILDGLMHLYDGKQFKNDSKTTNSFSQPSFVEQSFSDLGIIMNGEMQFWNDMVFLPKTYLMPLDMYTYLPMGKSDYTYAIHWCNGGWRDEKATPDMILVNRRLWGLCEVQT